MVLSILADWIRYFFVCGEIRFHKPGIQDNFHANILQTMQQYFCNSYIVRKIEMIKKDADYNPTAVLGSMVKG